MEAPTVDNPAVSSPVVETNLANPLYIALQWQVIFSTEKLRETEAKVASTTESSLAKPEVENEKNIGRSKRSPVTIISL